MQHIHREQARKYACEFRDEPLLPLFPISEAIRKEKACFQGATVTALRGRASIVAKTRPRKAVTVAPNSIPASLLWAR